MVERCLTRCAKCGETYWGDRKSLRCNNCKHQSPAGLPKRTQVCAKCGNKYMGYPSGRYCATCRVVVRNAQGGNVPARKLGSIDRCAGCGNEYVVASSSQRYCAECRLAKAKKKGF